MSCFCLFLGCFSTKRSKRSKLRGKTRPRHPKLAAARSAVANFARRLCRVFPRNFGVISAYFPANSWKDLSIYRKKQKNDFSSPTPNRLYSTSFVKTSPAGSLPSSGTAALTDLLKKTFPSKTYGRKKDVTARRQGSGSNQRGGARPGLPGQPTLLTASTLGISVY